VAQQRVPGLLEEGHVDGVVDVAEAVEVAEADALPVHEGKAVHGPDRNDGRAEGSGVQRVTVI
jgi:hypothetical protein